MGLGGKCVGVVLEGDAGRSCTPWLNAASSVHVRQNFRHKGSCPRAVLDPSSNPSPGTSTTPRATPKPTRTVIHEDAIKVGGTTKAPDYCGVRKFFLEAKRPSVDIKSDIVPAYQLHRYAWTGRPAATIERQNDQFACEFYGLADEEGRIVEAATR